MSALPKPCLACGVVVPDGASFCVAHRREIQRARAQLRGSAEQRGYGASHRRLRRQWVPRVATGEVPCARCGLPIERHQAWDLDHDPSDPTRSSYLGPSHADCNRSAGGRW
jgi:hypothetical protein